MDEEIYLMQIIGHKTYCGIENACAMGSVHSYIPGGLHLVLLIGIRCNN